jgi:hypothetical protein
MLDDIPKSPLTLEQYAAPDMTERRKLWIQIFDITEDDLNAQMAAEKAREAGVPQIGSEAPDFVADVLDGTRQRTGEQVRLSELRGEPVGWSSAPIRDRPFVPRPCALTKFTPSTKTGFSSTSSISAKPIPTMAGACPTI